MTTKLRMHETIENAFIAGLLLTGSVERAEKAILESVKMACPDELYGKALFRRALRHSIDQQMDAECKRKNDLDRAKSILPFELSCVLGLAQPLRSCYVLRILVGLPREVCAWLLHLEILEVDQQTRAAIVELPLVQQRERDHAEKNITRKSIRKGPHLLSGRRRSLRRPFAQPPVSVFTSTKIIQFDRQANNY